MNQDAQTRQDSIDAYLARLRHALGSLREEEVDDILREIRGHIAEQLETAPRSGDTTVERILSDLGRPEEIGSLYRTDAMVTRARATFSPLLLMRAALSWARDTALGFVAVFLGLTGYGLGLALLACAFLKPFYPDRIGLWIYRHGANMGWSDGRGLGRELLGWWIIPMDLLVGTLVLICTVLLLRWMLRFAWRRLRPTTGAESSDAQQLNRGWLSGTTAYIFVFGMGILLMAMIFWMFVSVRGMH